MTEIKLTLEDLRDDGEVVGPATLREHAGHLGLQGFSWVARLVRIIADQVEEQAKPVVEEPQETFSVVKARDLMAGDSGLFWTRLRGGWVDDGQGVFRGWLNLEVYEVLRVGIGNDRAWRNGYEQATKHTRERIYNRLTALKAKLITAPEKNAIEQALAEVEKDVEDTVTGRGYPS